MEVLSEETFNRYPKQLSFENQAVQSKRREQKQGY